MLVYPKPLCRPQQQEKQCRMKVRKAFLANHLCPMMKVPKGAVERVMEEDGGEGVQEDEVKGLQEQKAQDPWNHPRLPVVTKQQVGANTI